MCKKEGLCFLSFVGAVLGLGVPAAMTAWVDALCNSTVKATQGSVPGSSAGGVGQRGVMPQDSVHAVSSLFPSFLQWFVSSTGHGCCCVSSWH